MLPACSGARFVPKPEERLLSVVHALLHRCYKLPFSDAADVPESLRNELSGMQGHMVIVAIGPALHRLKRGLIHVPIV